MNFPAIAVLLIQSTAGASSGLPAPVNDPPAMPTTSATQKLDGAIDASSRRVLLPDDPLPENSLLIEAGTDPQQHGCKGRIAEIRGDYRIVELTDACPLVRIRGHFNVVRVQAVEQIDIVGDDNALTWHTVPGDETGREKPVLSVRGSRNLVAPGN